MAYIIGLVSPEEEAILKQRGWELETPPVELKTPDEDSLEPPMRTVMVYVDNDMFDIMSGSDWDTSQISLPIRRRK